MAGMGGGLLGICLGVLFARAATDPAWPARGKSIEDFVPGGYSVLGRAECDFNGDKRQDLVLVLQKKGDKGEIEGTPRWLVILFKQADGSYRLSLRSQAAVPGCGSGLRADEEFAGPWAVNDTFKIRHGFSDGHSGVTTDYQFRFRNGAWQVIGKRSEFLGDVGRPQVPMDEAIAWTSRVVDANYLTGTRIETWSCGSCDDPVIELTLTYRDGEHSRTLQECFGKSEDGQDLLSPSEKDEN
jgi:hypothetical protein